MSFKESCYVDIAETVNHISLCTGYGGIDIGLKRAISGLRTIAYSEIEAFACANLVAKMEAGFLDPAPIWTDLKTFPWADFYGLVDILSGGYPCQPFSSACKRLGSEDHRHLWPFISAGIAICRPRICFFENVEGHISLGLSTVISDLEEMGYEVSWGIFSASEVGAPHQRKRVFILAQLSDSKYMSGSTEQKFKYQERAEEHLRGNQLAHNVSKGRKGWLPEWSHPQWQGVDGYAGCCGAGASRDRTTWPTRTNELVNAEYLGHDATEINRGYSSGADSQWTQKPQVHRQSSRGCCQVWPSRPGEQQHTWEPPRVVANTKSKRTGQRSELCKEERGSRGTLSRNVEQPSESKRSEQRQTQPPLGRDADGPADWLDDARLYSSCDNRADELRLLGNGVVPQVAEKAFISLLLGGDNVLP